MTVAGNTMEYLQKTDCNEDKYFLTDSSAVQIDVIHRSSVLTENRFSILLDAPGAFCKLTIIIAIMEKGKWDRQTCGPERETNRRNVPLSDTAR